MKRVGILTGISYASGVDYYRGINEKVGECKSLRYKTVPHSSKALLVSLDLDEYATRLKRGEKHGGQYEEVADWIAGKIRPLADACDFLVIASNTGHVAAKRIQELYPAFPLLHIADSTASAINEQGLKKVGLLGTSHTMKGSYIIDRIRRHGIEVIVPSSPEVMQNIQKIICEELSRERFLPASRKYIVEQIHSLQKRGAEGIILGCTELELICQKQHVPGLPVFRSARLHIEAAAHVQLNERTITSYAPRNVRLTSSSELRYRFVAALAILALTALAAAAVIYPDIAKPYVQPVVNASFRAWTVSAEYFANIVQKAAPFAEKIASNTHHAWERIGHATQNAYARVGEISQDAYARLAFYLSKIEFTRK